MAAAFVGDVVAIEADGRRIETVAAPGFRERFLLTSDVDRTALLRLYNGDGELIGAARDENARFGIDGEVLLKRQGARVRAERDFELLPDPLRLDHAFATTCFDVFFDRGSTGSCLPDFLPFGLSLSVGAGCAPARGLLYGPVAARVRSVELVLGGGRRLRAPAAQARRRAVALRARTAAARRGGAQCPRPRRDRSCRRECAAARSADRAALPRG